MHTFKSSLTAKSISFEFPNGDQLFTDLSFTIGHARYGLVGENGIGKSTLARILAGDFLPSSGEIISNGQVILFSQEEKRPSIILAEYLSSIWEEPWFDAVMYSQLMENIDLDASLESLSGGEWTRARLAKVMASTASLLILDEPTNNLDTESKKKIFTFIKKFHQSSLLVISHDRTLLNHVDTILEMTNQGISTYGGNFDFYTNEKDKERRRQIESLDDARKEKDKIQSDWLKKNQKQAKRMATANKNSFSSGLPKIILGAHKRRAGKTLANIQSKEKSRLASAQSEFQNVFDKVKIEQSMMIEIPEVSFPNGKKVFEVENGNILLNNGNAMWATPLSIIAHGPIRMAIQGSNGSGKSSFIKALLGLDSEKWTLQGQWSLGKSLNIQVLDQSYDLLDSKKSVLENLTSNSSMPIEEIQNLLARLQFPSDKVHQSIKTLSGGEKLKVSLGKIFYSTPTADFIILDEPTNNLDLVSLNILENCLKEYKGALLVVSHDSVFLKNINIKSHIEFFRSFSGKEN